MIVIYRSMALDGSTAIYCDEVQMQNGICLARLRTTGSLRRDDGSSAQVGDVLSVQADGSWQSRPGTANGPYEVYMRNGSVSAWAPLGSAGKPYVFPTFDVPNG